jgi:hypothetical protein
MHVPKTAGLSTARYILKRVGWRRTRRSADLAEMPWNLPVAEEKIARANSALFVFGHMSFATIDRLDSSRHNYIFTFLREPRSRLWSFYKHLNTYLEKFPLQPTHGSYPLMVKCAHLTAAEFFLTEDPSILTLIDNQVVRQFAGRMADYPIEDSNWPGLLEQAKANLRRTDFIGFQESYTADLRLLLKAIKLAQPRVVPHVNRAIDGLQTPPAGACPPAVEDAVDRLTRWDREFFEFALQLKRGPTDPAGACGA